MATNVPNNINFTERTSDHTLCWGGKRSVFNRPISSTQAIEEAYHSYQRNNIH